MADDLYSILGVARSASEADIKKAYRRLAKENHPDIRPNDKAAEERFKKATAAFEVLGDAKKRKLYDEFGEDAEKIGFDEKRAEQLRQYKAAAGSGMGGGFPFGGGGGGGGVDFDLGDLFAEMFGRAGGGARGAAQGFGQRRPRAMAGEDLSTPVTVTLNEAVAGGERVLNLQRPGQASAQQLTVKIPPGVQSGSRVRLGGQGGPGVSGGPPGDLYLDVEVLPHPAVRREGDDLYMDLPITVPEAVLGAEVRVPTFDGDVTVRVPAGFPVRTQAASEGPGRPRPARREPGGPLPGAADPGSGGERSRGPRGGEGPGAGLSRRRARGDSRLTRYD